MNRVSVSGRHISVEWDVALNVELLVEIHRYGGMLKKVSCGRNLDLELDQERVPADCIQEA